MPTRYKSELPEASPLFKKDEVVGEMIESILSKYPQHKRVLYLRARYENDEVLSVIEIGELKKFNSLLGKK